MLKVGGPGSLPGANIGAANNPALFESGARHYGHDIAGLFCFVLSFCRRVNERGDYVGSCQSISVVLLLVETHAPFFLS